MEGVHCLVLSVLIISICSPILSYENFNNDNDSSVSWYFINQKVNHFMEDSPQFKQRYYLRDDLWKAGGPVYVYIGGEYTADGMDVYLTSGLMADLARETHGAIYLLEHRYHGLSTISSDLEETQYGNLSVKQVLGDIAFFLTKVKAEAGLRNSKVVLVGGSYAGRLVTWMRLKHPDLVDAAIASSAPLKNALEFPEYYETVSKVYRDYGGYHCLRAIQNKIRHERALLRRGNGEVSFKLEEHFCPEVEISQKMEQNMYSALALNHITDPVIEFDLKQITAKCDQILGIADEDSTIVIVDRDNDACYSYNFSIQGWPQSPYDFLQCAELAQFATSSDKSGLPFDVPIQMYTERCAHVYGEKYNEENIRRSLTSIDEEYGGTKPNVTNIVFVNGGLDPWHHLGVLNDLSKETPALFIRNGTHCQDLYPDQVTDSFELRDVRARIKEFVKDWIDFRIPAPAKSWTFFKPSPSWDHME